MKVCTQCNSTLEDDVKFCIYCGHRLEEPSQPTAQPQPIPPVQPAYQQPVTPPVQPVTPPVQPVYQQQAYQQPVYQQPVYQQPQQDGFEAARQAVGNSLNTVAGYSEFDGGLLQLIGWGIVAILLTTVTLGLGFPWAYCIMISWETKHTIINGRRLMFDGTGLQLIGKWIIWILLTIITFGIYSFWLGIKLKQWQVSHTHFAN